MLVGARHSSVREDVAVAQKMLAFWDQSWSKNLAASFLAFLWFGAGGYSVLPVGLLLALGLMLPDVPSWSIWQRLSFASRQTLTLVLLSLASFFLAHAQVGILHRDGRVIYAEPQFLVPSALGWIKPPTANVTVAHQKACARGAAESCATLAHAHLSGNQVERDPNAAVGYFQSACDLGHPISCVGLGRMYSRGQGVSSDREKARQLYGRACEEGELVGCHNLGALYLSEGKTVSALDTLKKSCSAGFARSCYLVGERYQRRRGKDRETARLWLGQACSGGVREACDRLKD